MATSSLSSSRTNAPRSGRLAAPADEGMTMATNKKDGSSQPSRSQKAPEKPASRSIAKKGTAAPKRAQPKAMAGSRSATKSQAVPAKARSAAGSRTAARATSGASRSRSATRARSGSQPNLLNPMAWLSSLETTLTSPQARAIMAEALRAVANVLEKPQASEQGRKASRAAARSRAGTPCRPQEASAPRLSPLRWRSQRRPLEPQVRW
jgi:hypothetical protein